MNDFSVGECIRFGWETFKKRPWFFAGVLLFINIIIGFSLQTKDGDASSTPLVSTVLFTIAAFVLIAIQMYAKMGKVQFLLKAHDTPEAARFGDLWAPHPFWKYVGASILFGVIVIVGFLLLIIPGIIWGLRYMFVPYLVVERKLKPFEALKESARITYGHKWDLFVFVLAIIGINILGLLCLVVGLLVSTPVSSLAFAHAYRKLSAQAATPVAA